MAHKESKQAEDARWNLLPSRKRGGLVLSSVFGQVLIIFSEFYSSFPCYVISLMPLERAINIETLSLYLLVSVSLLKEVVSQKKH